jgi:predicted DNA-binding protein
MTKPARTSAVQKTALSLPRDVYDRLEALRRVTGDTRSGIIRRAIEELFANLRNAEKSRRYVEGYRRFPDSRAEVRAAAIAAKRLAEEPWE